MGEHRQQIGVQRLGVHSVAGDHEKVRSPRVRHIPTCCEQLPPRSHTSVYCAGHIAWTSISQSCMVAAFWIAMIVKATVHLQEAFQHSNLMIVQLKFLA